MIIDKISRFLNQLIVFLIGIFTSAVVFFLILKISGVWGVSAALLVGFYINYDLRKKYPDNYLVRNFNLGLFSFNLLTALIGILLYLMFYGALQNILN